MADFYYTASRGDGTTLYIAPLTERVKTASGQELPSESGHFLFERNDCDPTAVRILAHLFSEEAIFEIKRLLPLDWS